MINAISQALSHFSAYHYLIIGINLLGGKLSERQIDYRVNVLRVLNLAILAAVCYNAIYSGGGEGQDDESKGFAIKLISILVILYLAYLASNIASYVMRRRYGKTTQSSEGHSHKQHGHPTSSAAWCF